MCVLEESILAIKKSDVYTFGDAENDLLMITNFNGVAMGNAQQPVKDIADEITDDNEHDGIAKSLYKHIPQLHTFD